MSHILNLNSVKVLFIVFVFCLSHHTKVFAVNKDTGIAVLDETILGADFFNPKKQSSVIFSIKSNNFKITHDYLVFNIQGTYNPFRTSLNLWYNGEIVKTATGSDSAEWQSIAWDVKAYKGKEVYLQIVDADALKEITVKVKELSQRSSINIKLTGSVEEAIQKAKELALNAIKANEKKASEDINRPVYHFRPSAQRMNDPNGTFYANGYYHFFYQHNPLADRAGSGYMLWGHARSRDLVNWEYLPIALWPDWRKGELHCYSGGAFENGKDNLLFYTSVYAAGEPRTQSVVIAENKDFIKWEPYTDRPVLPYFPANSPDPGLSWRDPFVFEEKGKVFMLLTTSKGVGLYQAVNKELTQWDFKNIIYKTKGAPECPNFFKFGNKWLLLVSPQNPVEYVSGTFDAEKAVFTPEKSGTMNSNAQYYATQGLVDGKGRQILFGLIKGFKNGMGWRDCAALPRVLTLAEDGTPRQLPVKELEQLRGKETVVKDITVNNGKKKIPEINGNTVELELAFKPGTSTSSGIRVKCSEDGTNGFEIRYENNQLILPETKIQSPELHPVNGEVKLRVFIDKGAIEVFSNDGKIAEVRVYYSGKTDMGIEFFSTGGEATLLHLKKWDLQAARFDTWNK